MKEETCRHPKVSEMTEEHYEGVFQRTPIAVFACLLCTACGVLVRGWRPTNSAEAA